MATPNPPPATEGPPLFVAPTPFDGRPSKTLVIYCADGRFRPQMHEFLTQCLKLDRPVTFTLPGGISIFMPLVGLDHHFSKVWLDAFIGQIDRIVVIAHEDCAAYKAEHDILHRVATTLLGKSLKVLQQEHLNRALATLRVWYPQVKSETYYADIIDGPDSTKRVAFRQKT